MRLIYALAITLDVISNYIGISSCSPPKEWDFLKTFGDKSDGVNPQDIPPRVPPIEKNLLAKFGKKSGPAISRELGSRSQCPPDGGSIIGAPRCGPSHSPGGRDSPGRAVPTIEPHIRDRSISPRERHFSPLILGYKIDKIRFIRLIPYTNPHRLFQIQRYTFPADAPIQVKFGSKGLKAMPIEERCVLTTSEGDALAILEKNSVFRGIYTIRDDYQRRAKINIYSGIVQDMTPEECKESPIGTRNSVKRSFRIVNVNSDDPHEVLNQRNLIK